MSKILIIDNFDSFTFNLANYFFRLNCQVEIFRNTIEPDFVNKINPDAIVFSPGPSVPKNAGNMMQIIKKYYQKYPMLGVCLGHEALIECFGGSLKFIEPVHGEASEITHDHKTIFRNITQDFFAGRYHSLVAEKIPAEFEISAKHKNLIMAIRHKKLPLEGVQFHPESVLTMKDNNGFKIIQNFLETYVNKASNVISFLEKSINQELSLTEQENFLKNYQMKNAEELKEIVIYLQKKMPPAPILKNAIDICGTGGSGLSRINTSTINSFVLASLGVKVAKHGNKASSGRFGSFDLLEKLEINFQKENQDIEEIYEKENLAFLFAPKFHPIMKYFSEVRKKIGSPTFFNLIGPLLNPAKVKKQIIGVAFKDKMNLLAETCKLLGKEHVYIVCGEDNLDEVTITGKTHVCELKNNKIENYEISPKDFGLKIRPFEAIRGGNEKYNTKIALKILKDKCETSHLDLILVNSALALKLAAKVKTFREGYKLALYSIKNKKALRTFQNIKLLSKQSGILLKIIKNKLEEIQKYKNTIPLNQLKKIIKKSKRNFKKAISNKKMSLIAEIKKKSPSQGILSSKKLDIIKLAKNYENIGVNAISVLCEKKYFNGNLEDLRKVSEATKKIPILCKDFIIDEYQIYQAREFGADAILLIASILSKKQIIEFLKISEKLNMHAICEVHNKKELRKVLDAPAGIIGINNRDLTDMQIDLNTSIVIESGIKNKLDINSLPKNINAVLVGTSIMQSKNKKEKIQELLNKN